MARVVVFASNQCMAADTGTTTSITTDPVPLNEDDRTTAILVAHYLFGGGGAGNVSFSVQAQVSNDGVVFVNSGAPYLIDQASDTPVQVPSTAVVGAYLRYQFSLTSAAATPAAHICFDLHAKLDHV